MDYTTVLEKVDDRTWELPSDFKPGMRVPGRIYADESLMPYIA